MMYNLIGISGKAQSGKSTVANYLREYYGFYKLPFAKALKEMVGGSFEMNKDDSKTFYSDLWGMTKRELLQKVGTKLREVHPDIWIYMVRSSIVDSIINTKGKCSFVIPDVRYPNEMKAIKEDGGVLIRTIRTDYISNLTETEQNHPSETSLDRVPDSEFDLVITAASGDIYGIQCAIDKFME